MPTPRFTETACSAISPVLTPKQERFVAEYLIDLNATQAAIRAGYSKKTANQIGPELLGKTWFPGALKTAMADRAKRTELDQDWVLEQLKENYERAMRYKPIIKDGVPTGEYVYNGAVANRALELIGKHFGMFVERVDHSGEITVTAIKRTIVDPGNG